jgi:nucleoid-associated protein YgaU
MALRQEDLEFQVAPQATVYRFPAERSEVARIRAGIVSRRAARRRHRAGLAAVALAVVGMTLLGGGQEATAPAAQGSKQTAVVQPGETLWDIAERHAPEGMDLRVYIAALEETNDLGPVLQAGARIRLP